MKVDDSVKKYVERSVGEKVSIIFDRSVDSDVEDKIGGADGKVVEL